MPSRLLWLAVISAFVGAAVSACAREQSPVPDTPVASPGYFACGELECRLGEEYCRREYPGAVAPGTPGYRERCAALPHPDCKEVERSGKCLGSPETGMTIEIYFP